MVCGSPSIASRLFEAKSRYYVTVSFFLIFVNPSGCSFQIDTKEPVGNFYATYTSVEPNHVTTAKTRENASTEEEYLYPFKYFRPILLHEKANCTPPTIQDFPPDMFTQQQRQQGAVVVHFLLAIYAMLMIGVVVDEYFVPCLDIIASVLGMSADVAGATIMAIGTSSPELFTNVVGTFITQGDIGVGTIVGSAVFNILAAPACCGLAAGLVVPLEWWALTRDCIIYGLLVIALALVLADGLVYWWEAMILILFYGIFLLLMYFNRRLEKIAKSIVKRVRCGHHRRGSHRSVNNEKSSSSENLSSIEISVVSSEVKGMKAIEEGKASHFPTEEISVPREPSVNEELTEDGPVQLFQWPDGSWMQKLYWILMWLGNLIFFLTVPDVRRPGWRRLYPLTFLACVIWIGSLTYLVTWFITVIGYTLGAPDSVMGITFLAAGGSVPEAVATIVVARQGKGSMGISNSVGSNSFDIMICMGIPWLIKAAAFPAYPQEGNFVAINSGGVVYSVVMLFCTILILYFAIAFNKFHLDRKVGGVLLVSYILFLILASLFELNVFLPVNAPTCESPLA